MRDKRKSGFTLVELIVVMAIIAILSAVAIPTTIHFVEKAEDSNRNAFVQQIGKLAYNTVTFDDGNVIQNGQDLIDALKSTDQTLDDKYELSARRNTEGGDPVVNRDDSLPNGEVITVYYSPTEGKIICRFYLDKKYKNIYCDIDVHPSN
ncbi:MAG: type II secretion system protein [Eubacteriales bacterium]|nr:type II secretion system protein [Eubacteriales bacterium]